MSSGKYLLIVFLEAKRLKSEASFKQLASILSQEELANIAKSSSQFRENFKVYRGPWI